MSAALLPAALLLALAVSALAGPRLIRAAAPALMRAPQTAAVLLILGLGVWIIAAGSLALVLAAMFTGPQLLPGAAGEICRRCLAAASPLAGAPLLDIAVPSALFLAAPVVALSLGVIVVAHRARQIRRATRAHAQAIRSTALVRRVRGHAVLVLDDEHPQVFSLPRREGGIVVSTGLLSALAQEELDAVLAHEREHLRARHHLLRVLVHLTTASLGALPLARAVGDAVPLYLEMAADAAAVRATGTRPLARALLLLGSPSPLAANALVLHAPGPDRIGRLVRPPLVRPAVFPALALTALLIAFVAAIAVSHTPYVAALLAGCGMPSL